MNKYLFNGEIYNWESWGKIFHSIEAWEPLVNFILEKENLPVSKIENLTPGTNAVFKSGDYVVKIFAPNESSSDVDGERDFKTEKFALSFAQSQGVPVSRLISYGEVKDKYDFYYMILAYINGVGFEKYSENFTDGEKFEFGKRLRKITDLMNKPCEDFNGVDVLSGEGRYEFWGKYSERFRKERLEYLKSHDFGEKVFVHGDLCEDNFVINNKGGVYIIDFADAVRAPICYEHAHLIGCIFNYDKAYLRGYFGEYETDELTDICFDGLLIHDFGGDFINWDKTAKIENIYCLADFREWLYNKLK